MTPDFRMALLELLRKHPDEPEADALEADAFCDGLRWPAHKLMELVVGELVVSER
ncbi:MAG: hypothetical protein KM312_13025 [Hydrogenibacillus schlegelii]|uniref:Uncharacterized protein n=1 Tax=Hydrogenibacillus schlegelii TaxID=1484 RepID=A0A947CXJ6_HYDSH|nr:hypothetical protein [Hydrogenibacillus schlegelii]MBT9283535.1 hypothetical protein [Hydrogenibacillus schlegelii]